MQYVQSAADQVVNTASNLATTAASYLPSSPPTALAGFATATTASHSHSEEHSAKGKQLPPDAQTSEVKKMDSEGLAVFEDECVRHAILVKINQLAIDDQRHGLKELAALNLVTDTGKRGVDFYHPQRYLTVTRPVGVDWIGEIEIEDGKSIHDGSLPSPDEEVRCHTPAAGGKATFHSLDTRPGQDGGAVFKTGEALSWFEY